MKPWLNWCLIRPLNNSIYHTTDKPGTVLLLSISLHPSSLLKSNKEPTATPTSKKQPVFILRTTFRIWNFPLMVTNIHLHRTCRQQYSAKQLGLGMSLASSLVMSLCIANVLHWPHESAAAWEWCMWPYQQGAEFLGACVLNMVMDTVMDALIWKKVIMSIC